MAIMIATTDEPQHPFPKATDMTRKFFRYKTGALTAHLLLRRCSRPWALVFKTSIPMLERTRLSAMAVERNWPRFINYHNGE
jgi:hypothetical protein